MANADLNGCYRSSGPNQFFWNSSKFRGIIRAVAIGALGACVVSSADEYRAYADECFGWAKTARTEKEREIFLQMARTWLEAAVHADRRSASTEPAPDNNKVHQAAK
jgi:hypothetical protein